MYLPFTPTMQTGGKSSQSPNTDRGERCMRETWKGQLLQRASAAAPMVVAVASPLPPPPPTTASLSLLTLIFGLAVATLGS